jgi:hypothetical protein
MTTLAATTTATATPAVVTAQFISALAARDLDRIAELLDPDVWFRIVLPREIVEHRDASGVLARFRDWYVTPVEAELVAADHHTMAGREYLSYRFRLRPAWEPDRWHLIEQSGYVRVRDGRIRRLDLVCTGFHPIA